MAEVAEYVAEMAKKSIAYRTWDCRYLHLSDDYNSYSGVTQGNKLSKSRSSYNTHARNGLNLVLQIVDDGSKLSDKDSKAMLKNISKVCSRSW